MNTVMSALFSVLSLLKKLKQQSREALDERRPALIQALTDIGDFYLELKWDFQSWSKLNFSEIQKFEFVCNMLPYFCWVHSYI